MQSQQQRPPSGRDFEVFEAVILGGKTTREAAEQFKLSQTRICQIVERMRTWQAEVLPAESPHSDERLLRFARYVAAGRLDHLYGETMEAWRRSQGEIKKSRSARFGDDVTTTFFSPGDPKYVLAAMRLARARAELGVLGGLIYPLEDEEEVENSNSARREPRPPRHEATGRSETRPTKDHPAGDCSENGAVQPAAACAPKNALAITANGDRTSAELSRRDSLSRRQLFGPVQADQIAAGNGSPSTQIQITPQQLGLSVEEILSRQQRRKLQRARQAG